MEKPLIVLYTHTDAKDVWDAWYGQYEKYLSEYDLCLCVNQGVDISDSSLSNHQTVFYDDNLTYTQRLQGVMNELGDRTILFLHEDMILYSDVDHDRLETFTKLVNNESVKSVKLIYVGDICYVSSVHDELVENAYSKFSIQPTIIKTKTILDILESVGDLNIWDFENAINHYEGHYMVKLGNESKRGMFHYDSLVFPYVATAIVKGKWNYSEYPQELKYLFEQYGINPEERGVA
jgi:hypothetical protein